MKQSELIEFIESVTEKGELDAWLECNDESEVREAIIELIKLSGEVMRERIIANLLRCGSFDDGEYLKAIRTQPGVTLDDLKGDAP